MSTASVNDTDQNFNADIESWMDLLRSYFLSDRNSTLFLKGLHDHPEWINETDPYQQTPLMIASYRGYVTIVQALIQSGADLNLQDQDGWTALMSASLRGHDEVVKVLIQAGANLNLQDKEGCSALISASDYSCLNIVNLLIEAGADLNLQDAGGRTALIYVSGHTAEVYTEIAKTLIQAGADIHLKDHYGWTSLMRASQRGQVELVKCLMNQGVPHDQKTALHLAKECGQYGVVDLLEAFMNQKALNQALLSSDPSSGSISSSEPRPSSLKGIRL